MAAPSNTVWGSVDGQGKLGIAVSASNTNTQTTLTVDVWLAVKYNIDDSYNSYSFSYTNNSGTTSTSSDSDLVLDFGTTSGAGWADASQKKIKTHTLTYDKGTSSKTVNLSAKLNNLGSEEYDVSVSTSYTIPALASYTISYNANGGSGAPSSQTKYYGKTLTLSSTKPTRTGYTFQGWATSSSGSVTYSSGGSYTSNSAATLYAVWSEHKLTVNYYSNYATSAFSDALNTVGSNKNVLVYSQSFLYDNDYSTYGLANYSNSSGSVYMTRTGYTGTGNWGTSTSGGTLINENTGYSTGQALAKALGKDLSGGDASINLYAQWTENVLTVNYYSNYSTYASFKGEEISVSSNTNVLVHSQQFYYDNAASSGLADVQNTEYIYMSRTGYTPTGYWGTSTSGGTLINQSTTYNTGQALAQALGKSIETGNASVTVYPQWQINTYTISYDSNGGSGSMESQIIEWKETFTLSNNTFKREGYKLVGWNAYRNDDNTWYVIGQGWLTDDEILANGYEKKIYENQAELIFDASWIKGNEDSISQYTMYAIWEISGIVYIDNGTTFEPYLAYIDNGTSWELYLMYIDNGTDWNIIS